MADVSPDVGKALIVSNTMRRHLNDLGVRDVGIPIMILGLATNKDLIWGLFNEASRA